MRATLVQNVAGELRVELMSDGPEERAFIKTLGKSGGAVVVVTGSEQGAGGTEHYLTLMPNPQTSDDDSLDDEDNMASGMLKDEDEEW